MHLPPSFSARVRDGVYVLEQQTFCDAFCVLSLPMLSSKTEETAVLILNRIVWTNNKAFKYGASDSPLCYRCGETETMEHLLYLCPNYSEPLWSEASTTLTTTITHHTQEYTA
jgi:hypothetical protein